MMFRPLGIILILLLTAHTLVAKKIDSLDLSNRRVGVVLSGGGAKGLAHIGFLKALEQKGIRPTVISGTSMGALIGGLYAAGYSANQIDTIFQSIDFSTIFNDNPHRSALNILEKISWKPISLPFTLDSTFSLGMRYGLSAGQNIMKLLAMYTHHTPRDFDSLYIPFFAMSTDITAMREVKMDSGHLSYALRASSALPSAFTPLYINERVLSDGGILNNLPVKETRETNKADLIITHSVMRVIDSSKIKNIGDMVYRLSTIKMRENIDQQLPYGDINLSTNTDHIPVTDFSNIQEKIDLGYHTFNRYFNYIKTISPNGRVSDQKIPLISDSIYIKHITENQLPVSQSTANKLFFKEHEWTTFHNINQSVDYLFTEQRYENVIYDYSAIDSTLNLFMPRKDNSNKITLGGFYDNTYGINLNGGLDLKDFWIKGSRFITHVNIGKLRALHSKLYIDNGIYNGIGIDLSAQQFDIKVWSNTERGIDDYRTSVSNLKLYLMNRYRNLALIRYGVGSRLNHFSYDYLDNSRPTSKVVTERLFNFSHYLFTDLLFDNLDHILFPKKGMRIHLSAKTFMYLDYSGNFFNNPANYTKNTSNIGEHPDNIQLSLEYEQVFPLGDIGLYLYFQHHSTYTRSDYFGVGQLSTIGGNPPSGINSDFAIPFDGIELNNISSLHSSFAINKINMYYNWNSVHHIGVSFHQGLFTPIQFDSIDNKSYIRESSETKGYYSVSIQYGSTFLGIPIGVKWAKNLHGSFNTQPVIYFHVGYNL